jgi:RNA polymerase sigma-70 factor, ECF subfamily
MKIDGHDEFVEFWEQTRDKVRAYMFCACRNSSDAEDLTQDCYVRAIRSWAAFEGTGTRQAWLFALARSTQVDWIRRRKRHRRAVAEQDGHEPQAVPVLAGAEDSEAIWKAVGRLSPDQREVIHLRFAAGLSYAEIAGMLGLPIGTIRSRLFRSLQALREWVKG